MRPNLQRPCPQIADPDGELNETINQLISGHYFLVRHFRDDMLQGAPAGNRMGEARILAEFEPFPIARGKDAVRQPHSVCVF